MAKPVYSRILLKLSGEALMGKDDFGINPVTIKRMAEDIKQLLETGVQIGMVIGGGNIFRGAGLAKGGLDRVTGDHMGMLATVMNSLGMQDALEKIGIPVRVMSALEMPDVCEGYVRRRAIRHLEKGRVAIMAAGTGNPFFTTDSAASLRAIEIDADILVKATKVDGIYSADPVTNSDAVFYPDVSYDQVIREELAVMDTTAFVLCRDHDMPIRVMSINEPGALMRMINGETVGTLVHSGSK